MGKNNELALSRGTRFITGEEAKKRRTIIKVLSEMSEDAGFNEIVLPSLQPADLFTDKAGAEVLSQMYVFPDKKGRELALQPEGTAICQLQARTLWKQEKDVKVFYETRCWRYERPQAGRYREFTQFGVEILNPTKDYRDELIALGESMVKAFTYNYEVSSLAKRGLAYYNDGMGFEISCPSLGAQKQILGGGAYAEGIGFALGVDRLMLLPF